jgi:Sulfatase
MKVAPWKLFHPILFALFPGMLYYASNSSEALIGNIVPPLLWTVSITLAVWIVLQWRIRNLAKSSIYTSLFLLWFVSYAHVSKILKNVSEGRHIFAGYVVLLIAVTIYLYKKGLSAKRVDAWSGFLTIVGAYLIISSLWRIIPIEIERAKAQVNTRVTEDQAVKKELNDSLKQRPAEKPDIYYIVPDRYGRQDILKEFYGYDNTPFIEGLRERGFYVADKASANYPKTFLSLASSLNMRHITGLTESVGIKTSDNYPVFQMVQNNMVAKYLKQQGYRFIYSGDWWEPTRVNRLADRNINLYATSDEFLRKYAQVTVLNPVFAYVFKKGDILGFSDNRVRDNHVYKFAKLKKVAGDEPSPKFVLVHMLVPHSPYVFDKDCKPFDSKTDQRAPEEYIGQLQCTNKHLLEIIDSILAYSDKPPVIILQSDEGPFKVDEMNAHGEGIDWTKVSTDALRHHMHIINAYHVPAWQDNPEEFLYPSITPVNSFRLLFNTYFGTNFAKLEDRSYMIPHLNYPYDFREITDILVQ